MKLEEVIAIRIRQAREAAYLSQEALGVLAGIEEATAKVRIHQYEQGKHSPPFSMIERIGSALGKPAAWFICEDDMQELLLSIHTLTQEKRVEAIASIEQLLANKL
jgi:transcriptional regulator with XRE-family HTH domain